MPVISEKDIPREIWLDSALHIPVCLCDSYGSLIQKHNMTEAALTRVDTSSHLFGGRSTEDTLQHFAQRYGVNSCRVESLIIDPASAFKSIPDDIVTSFSEGKVAIIDMACGTGAAGASLLSTIAVLRANEILPKLPLDVRIIGGDCSDLALDIYSDMLTSIEPVLNSVGIHFQINPMHWEAEESYTTSEMFDKLFHHDTNTEEYMVVIANFAGALDTHYTQIQDSITHMFDRTHDKKCTIIWVESHISSSEKLFQKIGKYLLGRAPWNKSPEEEAIHYSYDWYHPFIKTKMPCRVLVKEYGRS